MSCISLHSTCCFLWAVNSSINAIVPVPLAAIHAWAITEAPSCLTDEAVFFCRPTLLVNLWIFHPSIILIWNQIFWHLGQFSLWTFFPYRQWPHDLSSRAIIRAKYQLCIQYISNIWVIFLSFFILSVCAHLSATWSSFKYLYKPLTL